LERHPVLLLASDQQERTGLLGWASAVIGIFRVDGLSVRLNRNGALSVSWPARRGHPTVIPAEPALFEQVEAVVIRAYIFERAKAGRRGPNQPLIPRPSEGGSTQ
jgi:hypothetical protein